MGYIMKDIIGQMEQVHITMIDLIYFPKQRRGIE